MFYFFFFFSSRRRHTRLHGDWSSDVCSSDLAGQGDVRPEEHTDRDEQRDDGEERPGGAHALGGRRADAARAQRDERRQGHHEAEPQPLWPARGEGRRHRQGDHRREPDREDARDRRHSRSGEAGRGDASQRIATSTAIIGASTPPYHQSSESPATRTLATWFGSAPRRRKPASSSASRTTPMVRVVTGRII